MMEFLILAIALNLFLFLMIPDLRSGLRELFRSDGKELKIQPPKVINRHYHRAFGVREPGARAMPSHPSDKLLFTGWHNTFGWLRRPELDDENGYCYEDGDGTLYFTSRRAHKTAVLLDCWETEQGERYLAFHPIPSMSE